jgi:uncharacterized protein YndB with AHSA1/START domain
MSELTTSVSINASPTRVWQILIDVERWAEWTASIRRIEHLDPVPLGIGSRVRIEQPKLAPAVWTITDWQPESAFIRVSRRPGVVVTALHAIEGNSEGASRVTLDRSLRGVARAADRAAERQTHAALHGSRGRRLEAAV